MYARKYGDDNGQQSFRRGEYTIPANYSGNAFTADEIPDLSYTGNNQESDSPFPHEAQNEIPVSAAEVCCDNVGSQAESCRQNCPYTMGNEQCHHAAEEPRRGIFRDLLARFDRGFELDDLLLIGLIILLLNSGKDECESSRDEIIILLAFLLISGF